MNEQILEKLAEKLGVGVEHLIETLAAGAPAHGIAMLITYALLIAFCSVSYFLWKEADWYDDDARYIVAALIGLVSLVSIAVVAETAKYTIMSLVAPESWAAWTLIEKLSQ